MTENQNPEHFFSDSQEIQNLLAISNKLSDLGSVMSVLDWDQETYMPQEGVESRTFHFSTLAGIHHEELTSGKVKKAINKAEKFIKNHRVDTTVYDRALVRELKDEYDNAVKVPADFIKEEAELFGRAHEIWKKSREESNFPIFTPCLREIVRCTRQRADYFGWKTSPYDALLDTYEPGLTSQKTQRIFNKVKLITSELMEAISRSGRKISQDCLRGEIEKDRHKEFGLKVLQAMGFDFTRGRQDISTHPFMTSFGSPFDVRITTRFKECFSVSTLFSTIHEGGHALYEQGINPALARTHLADGASTAIHESQSRFWENCIAKSFPFWQYWLPEFKNTVLGSNKVGDIQLLNTGLEDFWRAINAVNPGFIRVNADEATYNLHIILRFELEKDLIEGKLNVEDLPTAWNAKMKEYLGIVPPDDASGVLQDIHWSSGNFGYFPTYTLGNLYAAQIYYKVREVYPQLDEALKRGSLLPIRNFLKDNIHYYGSTYLPKYLIRNTTGESLNLEYFRNYLFERFSQVYGF